LAIPIILKMKGGIISRFANNPGRGKEDNIFKNNTSKDQDVNEQIELFSEIIIDIYLQNEKHHEKGRLADGS
jgi:hypothetical protein